MEKWTTIIDYIRKVPVAFLVAILVTFGLVLFVPDKYAQILAIDTFRTQYRIYLGPAFLLLLTLFTARLYTQLAQRYTELKVIQERQKTLHYLTPEEKSYLAEFIYGELNSIYVGMEDGVMAGLRQKGITYLASNVGNVLDGFAFNLQPWARQYLQDNKHLLNGQAGGPRTPQEKLFSRW